MKPDRNSIYIVLAVVSLILFSCTKEFLDKKPDKKLIIPKTISEFQALLDHNENFNNAPFWSDWGTDNFYVKYDYYQTLSPVLRNAYIWQADILEGQEDPNWRTLYEQIFLSNIALDGIIDIEVTPSNHEAYNMVKGMALYYRALAFYYAAQIYAKPYDASSAPQEFGIPLRLSSNLNETPVRATVQETYDRIIQDLKEAASLISTPVDLVFRNRPSKPTIHAMLARVYLSMSKYANAGLFADSCLQKYNTLIDYNTLPTGGLFSIPVNNTEVFTVYLSNLMTLYYNNTFIDTTLFNSYDDNDLRKTLLFRGNPGQKYFTGHYSGNFIPMSAVATDEMYLTRAECYARAGNKDEAMADLNTLLEKRWDDNGSWISFTATDANDALNKILTERRKELLFRGTRWTDLRRLNLEPQFGKTIIRTLNSQTYTLPPRDARYVYQIPINEIQMSGIQQNPR